MYCLFGVLILCFGLLHCGGLVCVCGFGWVLFLLLWLGVCVLFPMVSWLFGLLWLWVLWIRGCCFVYFVVLLRCLLLSMRCLLCGVCAAVLLGFLILYLICDLVVCAIVDLRCTCLWLVFIDGVVFIAIFVL